MVTPRRKGGITLLVLNDANITRMFQNGGQAFRWASNILRDVEREAEIKLIEADGVKTGELLASIGHSTTPGGARKVIGHVRAEARHALWYHEGTPPHGISSRGPWKMRFFWERVGHEVKFYRVRHPGWRGNPFLRDAMHYVLRRKRISRL